MWVRSFMGVVAQWLWLNIDISECSISNKTLTQIWIWGCWLGSLYSHQNHQAYTAVLDVLLKSLMGKVPSLYSNIFLHIIWSIYQKLCFYVILSKTNCICNSKNLSLCEIYAHFNKRNQYGIKNVQNKTNFWPE